MSVVLVDKPDPTVTVVTLNRPDRLNAMSIELVMELADILESIRADNACRVIVLTGAGRAFCSGLDLKDHGAVPGIDGLQIGQIAQRSMHVYSRLTPLLRSLPQPVIAAVNGDAYGGGMCLTLGAELRFAAAGARFNATGIVNGLSSTEMGASWLLPRLVGATQAFRIMALNPTIGSEEALRLGLVSKVVEDADLDATIEAAARVFARIG